MAQLANRNVADYERIKSPPARPRQSSFLWAICKKRGEKREGGHACEKERLTGGNNSPRSSGEKYKCRLMEVTCGSRI